ncbi:MAG: DUF89 family protein [Desulfobulbaceae bacterium]|nr:DUF89 family protein [Desulfobulbaceae bacterium]
MKTTLDCLPCFLKQTLNTARLSTSSAQIQKKIMSEALSLIKTFEQHLSPPENATRLYRLIAELSGCEDPFSRKKHESNQFALDLQSSIKEKINTATDPLFAALRFSIAGNIIDYGSPHDFDIKKTIYNALNQPLVINDYAALQTDLNEAQTILYLGDNSGEIVFDGIVIEHLDGDVIFAVKEKAILNDALRQDANQCGLDRLCRVITNGTGCPGTPLQSCSQEFQKIFHAADCIISKGQGNFETLSEVDAPIYFLLTVKCPVVKDHVTEMSGRKVACGDMILMRQPPMPTEKRIMKPNTLCPCQSGKTFSSCCQPLLTNAENARSAESLMRSRYTAYVIKNTDYLLATWHSSSRPKSINRATIPDWQSLEIVQSSQGRRNDNTGIVEFKASALMEGRLVTLHEESHFIKENNKWFYLDGTIQNSPSPLKKAGRNAPCPCGSGKKFKKCCGP